MHQRRARGQDAERPAAVRSKSAPRPLYVEGATGGRENKSFVRLFWSRARPGAAMNGSVLEHLHSESATDGRENRERLETSANKGATDGREKRGRHAPPARRERDQREPEDAGQED